MLSLLKKLFSKKQSEAQDPWPFPPAIATSEAPVEVAPDKKPAAKKPRVAAKAPATRKPRAPRAQ